MTSVALLVNPTSGKGRGARAADLVATAITSAGFLVRPVSAPTADEAQRRLHAAVADGVAAVFAVGGDGLANMAINAIAETATPLGLIPAGTGNDLATSIGIPQDIEAATQLALGALQEGRCKPIDAVHVTGPETDRWFGCVLGAGFDSFVNERANTISWPRGAQRYNVAIALELPRFKPLDFEITCDGQSINGPVMLAAVGNAKSYGGGIKITAEAILDDGLMDLCLIGAVGIPTLLRALPQARRGAHLGRKEVTYLRGKQITIAAPRSSAPVIAYADGERFGPLPIECINHPGALLLLV